MISSKDPEIRDSIRLLKSEIIQLEATLKKEDSYRRPHALKSVSQGILLSAQRVKELIWSSYR